jgi:hypothetical protein
VCSGTVQGPVAACGFAYIFVLFKGIFVFRAEGERDARIVVENSVVFPRTRIFKVKAIESSALVVTETKTPPALLVEGEIAPPVIGAWRRHSFPVYQVQFVAIPESGRSLLQRTFFDVVERTLATL